ncbi:MAG TPA: OmpA family protein [Lacibacter sp.]|nr:OmpA family protein [Lacibacter sp.]HMO89456.1 OmpA family protein [Lacibacter sp.]
MASKKYVLLLGALCFLTTQLFAQSYDWKDETLVPKSGKSQHSEFLQNQYPFPAKPRNQWEVGLSVGNVFISGDVNTRMPNWGWGAHVRKAMGYVFSARLAYSGGVATGMNWNPSYNYGKNPAWANNYVAPVNMQWGFAPSLAPNFSPGTVYQVQSTNKLLPYDPASGGDPVFYNYKTRMHQLALQGVVTLNNVRFHKSKTGFIIYGIGGVGGMIYDVNVNAFDGNGGTYANLFRQVANSYQVGEYKSRNRILRDLRAGMDGTYETPADGHQLRRPKLFDMTFKPTVQAGFGVAFKLSKRLSLGIEEVHTWTNDDLLDGQRWQESSFGDASMTRDFDTWHYTNINLNYSLGAKSVEPLWWLNPLDYAYNELNAPRHMKLPKPVLDDADGDGVTDQFDLEPNTPAGCPVDTRGVSRDTDGDGVPDCKDKELITPTQCQPVDADGVGKCPDPECCKNRVVDNTCNLVDLPSINFAGNKSDLSPEAKALLTSIATSLRSNPNCKVVICGSAAKSKSGQALGQKRVDAIVKYLIEVQGISADRVVAQYDCSEGDPSVVEIRAEQK